jgi:hypothetical protein
MQHQPSFCTTVQRQQHDDFSTLIASRRNRYSLRSLEDLHISDENWLTNAVMHGKHGGTLEDAMATQHGKTSPKKKEKR